jgi:hypothetical protein
VADLLGSEAGTDVRSVRATDRDVGFGRLKFEPRFGFVLNRFLYEEHPAIRGEPRK